MTRALLILVLLTLATTARSDGISFNMVGQVEGISFSGAPAAVVPGCSGTGLIFNLACNSQYIGIL